MSKRSCWISLSSVGKPVCLCWLVGGRVDFFFLSTWIYIYILPRFWHEGLFVYSAVLVRYFCLVLDQKTGSGDNSLNFIALKLKTFVHFSRYFTHFFWRSNLFRRTSFGASMLGWCMGHVFCRPALDFRIWCLNAISPRVFLFFRFQDFPQMTNWSIWVVKKHLDFYERITKISWQETSTITGSAKLPKLENSFSKSRKKNRCKE